jgi:hypothetical protein
MKFCSDQTRKNRKRRPGDLALQFRELERLRMEVAKAEAEILKKAADKKYTVIRKPRPASSSRERRTDGTQ